MRSAWSSFRFAWLARAIAVIAVLGVLAPSIASAAIANTPSPCGPGVGCAHSGNERCSGATAVGALCPHHSAPARIQPIHAAPPDLSAPALPQDALPFEPTPNATEVSPARAAVAFSLVASRPYALSVMRR